MSLGMKSRMISLIIFTLVGGSLAASIAWPGVGTSNVATLAMTLVIAYYAFAACLLGALLAGAKKDGSPRRSESIGSLRMQVESRDKRSIFGRIWSFIDLACIALLAAYVGMVFGALLYTFLSMIIRLQYLAASELLKTPETGAESPA